MATVYRFDVECVSAFCSYPPETIRKIIEDSLTSFCDKDTGLKLESISVKELPVRLACWDCDRDTTCKTAYTGLPCKFK